MQLTPFLHTPTGLTVYMETDPAVSEFRATGPEFEARTAPFDEDKPKLKQALKEAKKRLQDQHTAKITLIQARIDAIETDAKP
jgi:hypothetical protein